MNKLKLMEQWVKEFITMNGRKPTPLEKMSWSTGYNTGEADK